MITASPAPAGGSKSRRASPRIVTTPLLRVFVAGRPISVNSNYRARGGGAARYLSAEARAWREAVAFSVMRWRYPDGKSRPDLAVSCIFIDTRADVDNLLKSTLDGIKDGIGVDDSHVLRLYAEKRKLTEGEQRGAWIEVRELPPQQKPQKPVRQRKVAP